MEPLDSQSRYFVLRGAHDFLAGGYLDALWYLDLDRRGGVLCLLHAPQQIKQIAGIQIISRA